MNREEVEMELLHFLNLDFLNAERKTKFINDRIKEGWSEKQLYKLEKKVVVFSNWNKAKYQKDQLDAKGIRPNKISYDGTFKPKFGKH